MSLPDLRKPTRGTALLAKQAKRKAQVKAEQIIMQAAKRRDLYRCQVPWCRYEDLPVDACHLMHRGMGGNPTLDRTRRDLIVTLCRVHHGELDAGLLTITPDGPLGTDGPCIFRGVAQ